MLAVAGVTNDLGDADETQRTGDQQPERRQEGDLWRRSSGQTGEQERDRVIASAPKNPLTSAPKS
jgi:hypothetical protein